MQAFTLRPIVAAFALLSLSATACGPTVFSDGDALAVVGTAPPPPVEAEPPPPEPEPQKRVEVRDNRIQINEKIQFEVNSSKIKEESHSLLNEVAQVIKDNPHIKKLSIEGHASSEGGDAHNKKLSDRRAKAVMKYLTKTGGIAKDMLSAKGFGEERPVASNDTEEGRIKNRRVEFMITEQDVTQQKVEVDDKGNEKVVEQKKVKG